MSSARYQSIDAVRGLMVVLAMLSHSILQFHPDFRALVPLTRTATPGFVILFGIMLELAYMRKLRAGGAPAAVDRRLIGRMVLCYLLFCLISLAAVVTGKLDLVQGLRSVTFVGAGRFGVILKIYAVLFLIVVLISPWLTRYGADLLIAMAALGWLLRAVVDAGMRAAEIDIYAVSFVVGSGRGFGPAILPSLTFLAFGMALGEALSGHRGRARAAAGLALAAALVGLEVAGNGPRGALEALLAARWLNQPLYFAAGIVTTSLYLAMAAWLWRRARVDPVSRGLADLGRQTLTVYAGGNVALNLLPLYRGGDAVTGAALTGIFMAVLLTAALLRARRPVKFDRALIGLPGLWVRGLDALVNRCVGLIQRPEGRKP